MGIGRADFFAMGDWNAVCYECGRKRKGTTLKKHWQGYYVCEQHWEPRQPQDFVRNIPDVITPPWAQPMPGDSFISGDALVTESSDLTNGDLVYITTETNVPLTTES